MTRQKDKRGDSKVESNDSPKIPDKGSPEAALATDTTNPQTKTCRQPEAILATDTTNPHTHHHSHNHRELHVLPADVLISDAASAYWAGGWPDVGTKPVHQTATTDEVSTGQQFRLLVVVEAYWAAHIFIRVVVNVQVRIRI